ncbi:peptidoglycan editing factor PgeF [Marinobacterium sp. AK62]|uniref:Purine nucleoside phosphorylase n=1 Tax=Marinobacterium alkalitolerans TaxID=1542925 RepID=A0ABS3ZC48_9GAMM|nr:peptidoglycan editing factor PgeF [Marinobacterium alkalitolerans]MBP0049279.1 peptidoglycan editing factor PgeF [Marinobacterium alkalitolerans]
MKLIRPQHPLAPGVQALTTTRDGGVSQPPWNSLNLGDHVGDNPAAVAENRARLEQALGIQTPQWLSQVHGINVVPARADGRVREADACWTRMPGVVCSVMTADCLPVLFADERGDQVAAAHAGWRGLLNGVLEATLATFHEPQRVHAWLGPAIGPLAFEVGPEVKASFTAQHADAEVAFQPSPMHDGRWLADLYRLAEQRLQRAGVGRITGGDHCTFTEQSDFFSYRRDGQTGRMASLIWIE